MIVAWWGVVLVERSPRNAPQGVEKMHSECRIDSESYDRANNTLWSALILIGKALYKNQLLYELFFPSRCSYPSYSQWTPRSGWRQSRPWKIPTSKSFPYTQQSKLPLSLKCIFILKIRFRGPRKLHESAVMGLCISRPVVWALNRHCTLHEQTT